MDAERLAEFQRIQAGIYDDGHPDSYYEREVREIPWHGFSTARPVIQSQADIERVKRRARRLRRVRSRYRRVRRYWSADARRCRKGQL